jgi:hypothetical protein
MGKCVARDIDFQSLRDFTLWYTFWTSQRGQVRPRDVLKIKNPNMTGKYSRSEFNYYKELDTVGKTYSHIHAFGPVAKLLCDFHLNWLHATEHKTKYVYFLMSK